MLSQMPKPHKDTAQNVIHNAQSSSLTSCVSLHELGKRQYKKIKCMLPFISKAGAVVIKYLMLVLIKEQISLGWLMEQRIREQR